jgi:hypothetical protein
MSTETMDTTIETAEAAPPTAAETLALAEAAEAELATVRTQLQETETKLAEARGHRAAAVRAVEAAQADAFLVGDRKAGAEVDRRQDLLARLEQHTAELETARSSLYHKATGLQTQATELRGSWRALEASERWNAALPTIRGPLVRAIVAIEALRDALWALDLLRERLAVPEADPEGDKERAESFGELKDLIGGKRDSSRNNVHLGTLRESVDSALVHVWRLAPGDGARFKEFWGSRGASRTYYPVRPKQDVVNRVLPHAPAWFVELLEQEREAARPKQHGGPGRGQGRHPNGCTCPKHAGADGEPSDESVADANEGEESESC